jgi:hypothetical protein
MEDPQIGPIEERSDCLFSELFGLLNDEEDHDLMIMNYFLS